MHGQITSLKDRKRLHMQVWVAAERQPGQKEPGKSQTQGDINNCWIQAPYSRQCCGSAITLSDKDCRAYTSYTATRLQAGTQLTYQSAQMPSPACHSHRHQVRGECHTFLDPGAQQQWCCFDPNQDHSSSNKQRMLNFLQSSTTHGN